jgi:DNA replication protein DnaC
MASDCPFGLCDGSGLLVDEDARTTRPCRCRPQVLARARAQSLSAVIPARYKDSSFDRPPVTDMSAPLVRAVRAYAGDIDAELDAGRGLWFMGDVGTGKTTLAMLVSRAALAAGRSVAIYSMPRLMGLLASTYDSSSEATEETLIDRLVQVDLLHVDDVGAKTKSDWVIERFYSIVNGRYEEQKSVVMTTNIRDRGALRKEVGERTVSRLTEMCTEIPVFGDDRRELAV